MNFNKLAKVSGQTPFYTPVDPVALLKCACKDCPIQCQCLCHTLGNLTHERKYQDRLKSHGGFFLVGALWSGVLVFFWVNLGVVGDIVLAASLLVFFWLCDLIRFFDGKWYPNLEAMKARAKRK